MNTLKNLKIIKISLLVVVVLGGLYLIGYQLNLFPWTQDNINKKLRDKDYSDAFVNIIEEDYFSFPLEKTVSFGEITDESDQIGISYEERVKEKESILVMEYEDASGQKKEAYVKSLTLDNENISYVLTHFTNYLDTRDLTKTEYSFKFSVDQFKPEEYRKETNSGTIVISNNKIFIIMSNDQTIDPFMVLFKENNPVDGTFIEYLKANFEIWEEVATLIEDTEYKEQQVTGKVSEDLKAFAGKFWQAYITLNTEDLKKYYASNVWFYAGDEWFEEWGIADSRKDKIHEFLEIENSKLITAYQNLKEEEFKEDLDGMQKLTDSIMLYPANDFMGLCFSENKDEFFKNFKIAPEDTIMVVRLDGGATCTIEGNFLAGELRFFVIKGSMGVYKVTTDFTE